MKLAEVIGRMKHDRMIHIGAENGSGWVAVDTALNVAEHLDEINDYLYKATREKYIRNQEKAEMLKSQLASFDKRPNAKKRKDIEIEYRYALGMMQKNDYKNWIPIWDRDVTKIYRHRTQYDGVCIKFKGNEMGDIWWYGEKKNVWEV